MKNKQLKKTILIAEDSLIGFGSAVKALPSGNVGGYLVLFSSETDPDLSGEFFTKNTDFVLPPMPAPISAVYFDHALDETLKSRVLGFGNLKIDDVGVWIEAKLEQRDDYEKAIFELAEAGKLGWSSGTAPHLVERKSVGNATEITRWALGLDASLTPTPCEARTAAVTLKSYAVKSKPLAAIIAESGACGKSAKGLFAEKLDKYTQPAIYDLTDALAGVWWQLQDLQYAASNTGAAINIAEMWQSAIAEFAAVAESAGNKYFGESDQSALKTRLKSLANADFPLDLQIRAAQDAAKNVLIRYKAAQKSSVSNAIRTREKMEPAAVIGSILTDLKSLAAELETFSSDAKTNPVVAAAKTDLKKREQDLRLKSLKLRASASPTAV